MTFSPRSAASAASSAVKYDPADRGAGRGGQALGDHLRGRRPRTAGAAPGRGARRSTRRTASSCVSFQPVGPGHLDGHPQRGRAGALADPGLEHPELALLDGELRVAHVAVVRLEPGEDGEQLVVDLREVAAAAPSSGSVLRMPATTSSPWALTRKSPYGPFSPVAGSRVKPTPVPDWSSRLPNTIACTFTAVPRSCGDALAVAVGDRPGRRSTSGTRPRSRPGAAPSGPAGTAAPVCFSTTVLVAAAQACAASPARDRRRRSSTPSAPWPSSSRRVEGLAVDVEHDPAVHRR